MKATVEVSRVVKGLEEQIDSFEKQKLHDIKTILSSFVTVQLSFHAKAVELLTKAYQDVAEIDEAQDLEVNDDFLRFDRLDIRIKCYKINSLFVIYPRK